MWYAYPRVSFSDRGGGVDLFAFAGLGGDDAAEGRGWGVLAEGKEGVEGEEENGEGMEVHTGNLGEDGEEEGSSSGKREGRGNGESGR